MRPTGTLRILLVFLLCSWGLFGSERPAFAKKIRLEWSPVEGASHYELEFQVAGKNVKKTVSEPRWSGDLKPGSYTYQVRAIDQVKRPGLWTEPQTLAVMPEAPLPEFPTAGQQVVTLVPKRDITLKWAGVPGAKGYYIDIKKDGKPMLRTFVEKNAMKLSGLTPGNYSWSVSGVIQSKGRTPASAGRTWQTPESSVEHFSVEPKKLTAPRVRYPKGELYTPDDEQLRFGWSEVEEASLYEVRVAPVKSRTPSNRELASFFSKARIYRTTETSLVIKGMKSGKYVWNVRAIASADEDSKNQVIGPYSSYSEGGFQLEPDITITKDLGYIALSGMLAPYKYQVYSPSKGFAASTSSVAIVGRASGEVWVLPHWGLSAAADYALFTLSNQTFNRLALEFFIKYRVSLFGAGSGWMLIPKFGAALRDYRQVYPSDLTTFAGTLTSTSLNVMGGAVGFDLRKQFSERFGLGLKVDYFYPLSISSTDYQGAKITSAQSVKNLSVGLQGIYWFGSSVGWGLGAYQDFRSISFLPAGGSEDDSIGMDATYFFTSVIVRLWK